jgi:hypothetical protein
MAKRSFCHNWPNPFRTGSGDRARDAVGAAEGRSGLTLQTFIAELVDHRIAALEERIVALEKESILRRIA